MCARLDDMHLGMLASWVNDKKIFLVFSERKDTKT
jgi:hypothetical protein